MNKIVLMFVVATASIFCGEVSSAAPIPESPFAQQHNRIAVFGSLHQVYERTRPHALYAGVEAWVLPIFALNQGGHTRVRHKDDECLLEAEFRMGYNLFYRGRDHFTPFGGVGVLRDLTHYSERGEHVYKHKLFPAIGYGTIGFLYHHEFDKLFNLGFNLKGIVGGGSSHPPIHWGGVVVGFDTALPITFRFGYHRRWDIRIEPFDIYLHGSDAWRNYFGFRGTVGFRF